MELLPLEEEERKEQAKVVDSALKELIFDAGFDAVEIQKPADRHHFRWCEPDGRKRKITTVLGLDAHCFEDYGKAEQLTLVKMTSRSMKGLSDAIKFPETRIRFACDLKEPPSPRLVGLSIHGSDQSFFEEICCGFSGNLNCIVGPRGSGKSTLIEALRYLFGYNRSLSELDYANRLSDRIKSLQNHNLVGSLVRVYYRREDGTIRILEATFDEKQDYTTSVFDQDGKGVPTEDVEKCGDYPLRLYGWSEIETLGRDQARQRLLLDRMVPNLQAAIQARTASRGELARNRDKIKSSVNELKRHLEKDSGDIFRSSNKME
jgi:energy-coupling factor transporter ATP-binding protein EcfA2